MMQKKVFTDPICIFGVRVDDPPISDLISFICETAATGKSAIIANVNVHALNLARNQLRFRTFLNNADVVFCDGFGIKWGARILGYRINHRNTPPDWIDQLCASCVDRGLTIYLLGAKPGVAHLAAENLLARHPGLKIAGIHDGYFNKAIGNVENQAVVDNINSAKPDILIVGFGMPLQEYWIEENWLNLDTHVVLPVGAMIDYVAGIVPRAPSWMTDHGLEWLGRLIIEPRRLWKRYIIGNPLFIYRVLLQKFRLLKLE